MAFGKNPPEGEKGPSKFLKFEAGIKQRLHIVSKKPLMFQSMFNKEDKKFIRIPEDKHIPGVKFSHKWAVVVLVEETIEGVSTTVAKVFEFGKMIKEQLDDAYEVYNNSFSTCDFIIGKSGKGLNTKWTATPCPAKGMKEPADMPKLEEVVKMSSDEDIALYAKPQGKKDDEGAPF